MASNVNNETQRVLRENSAKQVVLVEANVRLANERSRLLEERNKYDEWCMERGLLCRVWVSLVKCVSVCVCMRVCRAWCVMLSGVWCVEWRGVVWLWGLIPSYSP